MSDATTDDGWKACQACVGGRVALLTTTRICEACQGTGIDLSDARLDVALASPPLMVRTRKGLARHGVVTLRDLVCRAAVGLRPARLLGMSSLADARRHLASVGLPRGPMPPEGEASPGHFEVC